MNTANKKREDPEKIWEDVSLDGDLTIVLYADVVDYNVDDFTSPFMPLENLNDKERKWSNCDGERPCLWQHLRWSFRLRTFIGTSLPCLDGLTPVHHVDLDDPELLGEGRQGRRRPPEDEFIVMDVLIFCLVLHGRKSTSSFVMLLVMIAEMMAMFVILMMM